jgi:hypothetical protein
MTTTWEPQTGPAGICATASSYRGLRARDGLREED